jgi:hypothetical protein
MRHGVWTAATAAAISVLASCSGSAAKAPAPTAPASTGPASTGPASTAPASTAPASTAPASLPATPSTTTPSPPGPQDLAADKAAAGAASLKPADFPSGWTSTPHVDSNAPSIDGEVAACLGVSQQELEHNGPTDAYSADFSDPNANTASSSVGYTADAASAAKEFAIVAGPKMRICLTPALSAVVKFAATHPASPSETLPSGVTVGLPEVVQLPFPMFGDETVAYRVNVPINASNGGKPLSTVLYFDIVTLTKGRATASLYFQAAQTPLPTDEEAHFVGLVVGRLVNT